MHTRRPERRIVVAVVAATRQVYLPAVYFVKDLSLSVVIVVHHTSHTKQKKQHMICSHSQNGFVGIFCCGNRNLGLSQRQRRLMHPKLPLRWSNSITTTKTSVAATKVLVGRISIESLFFDCNNQRFFSVRFLRLRLAHQFVWDLTYQQTVVCY